MKSITLKSGTIKRIHVRQDQVRRLRKGEDVPTLVVQTSKGPVYGREITFGRDAVLTQRRKQLSCGARIYIETRGEVIVHP